MGAVKPLAIDLFCGLGGKAVKVATMGAGWYPPDHPKHVPGLAFNGHADRNLRDGLKNPGGGSWDSSRPSHTTDHSWESGTKNDGGSWFNVAHNTTSGKGRNPDGRDLRGVRGAESVGTPMLRSDDLPVSGVPGSGEGTCGDGCKTSDHINQRDGHSHTRHLTNPDEHGRKVTGDWFGSYADMKEKGTISPGRLHGKGSSARKAASAHIAKIPLPLAQWIARAWYPC